MPTPFYTTPPVDIDPSNNVLPLIAPVVGTYGPPGPLLLIQEQGGSGNPETLTIYDPVGNTYTSHPANPLPSGVGVTSFTRAPVYRPDGSIALFVTAAAPVYTQVYTWTSGGGWSGVQDFPIVSTDDIVVETDGTIWCVSQDRGPTSGGVSCGTVNSLSPTNVVLYATLFTLPGATTHVTETIWVDEAADIVYVAGADGDVNSPPVGLAIYVGTPRSAPVWTSSTVWSPDADNIFGFSGECYGRKINGINQVLFGTFSTDHGGNSPDRLYVTQLIAAVWTTTFFYDAFANPPSGFGSGGAEFIIRGGWGFVPVPTSSATMGMGIILNMFDNSTPATGHDNTYAFPLGTANELFAVVGANYPFGPSGTDVGVYKSTDGGATWTMFNDATDTLALFGREGWWVASTFVIVTDRPFMADNTPQAPPGAAALPQMW